jgi:hypothetical protein
MLVTVGVAVLAVAASGSALFLPRTMCLALGVVAAFAMAAIGIGVMGFRKIAIIGRIVKQTNGPE